MYEMSDFTEKISTLKKGTDAEVARVVEEFKSLPNSSLETLYLSDPLADAIKYRLKKVPTSGTRDDPVCQWLYEWTQLPKLSTKRFVLRQLPILVYTYISRLYQADTSAVTTSTLVNSTYAGLETVLLGVYNSQVVERDDNEVYFWPPSLHAPSPYTKFGPGKPSSASEAAVAATPPPQSVPTASAAASPPNVPVIVEPAPSSDGKLKEREGSHSGGLTASAPLAAKEKRSSNSNLPPSLAALKSSTKPRQQKIVPVLVEGRLPVIERINTHRRMLVLQVALEEFNKEIAVMPSKALKSFALMARDIACHGYPFEDQIPGRKYSTKHIQKPRWRMPLSIKVLQALLDGLCFCLFHPHMNAKDAHFAKHAVYAIHARAEYEVIPALILTAGSLQHMIEVGHPQFPPHIKTKRASKSTHEPTDTAGAESK